MTADGEELLLQRYGLPSEGHTTSRRSALQLGAAAMAAAPLASFVSPAVAEDGMFSVPPLPYAYDALEPTIDAATMQFHHDFHHQAYVNNLNKAMAGKDAVSLVSLMPGAKAAKLNNAGGGQLAPSLGPRTPPSPHPSALVLFQGELDRPPFVRWPLQSLHVLVDHGSQVWRRPVGRPRREDRRRLRQL